MLSALFKSFLESAFGQVVKALFARFFSPSTKPSAEAIAQSEKDRADAAEQIIVDTSHAIDARAGVRDDVDDIVRDPDNAG